MFKLSVWIDLETHVVTGGNSKCSVTCCGATLIRNTAEENYVYLKQKHNIFWTIANPTEKEVYIHLVVIGRITKLNPFTLVFIMLTFSTFL